MKHSAVYIDPIFRHGLVISLGHNLFHRMNERSSGGGIQGIIQRVPSDKDMVEVHSSPALMKKLENLMTDNRDSGI